MKNYVTLSFLFTFSVLQLIAQPSLNVELFGEVNRGDVRYSGTWSYVAPDGSEYALLGAKTGTAVYSIDDPDNIQELGFIPGPETNWREITVVGTHAFVVTDVSGIDHGMQVIDLSDLPNGIQLITTYTQTFTKGHIIQKAIDSDEPYVYVNGTTTTSGVHIMDISDPANPVEVGLYAPGYYIHDCHVRGNILFAAAFNLGQMDIVDVSDKSNPVLVNVINYSGSNTHSSSTTEDMKYLIIADEKDGNPAHVIDIQDLSNPIEVAQNSSNLDALVHNPYVRGDFVIIAHNTEGMRVWDIADPEVPVEVGFYDTFSGPSGGFSGLWSACPYFPSGKIIGGDRHRGLMIWEFNNTRAARIYGQVRDAVSGTAVLGATLEIAQLNIFPVLDLMGNFKEGMLAGSYSLEVSAVGYEPQQIDFTLAESDSLWMPIELMPENTNIDGHLSGIVVDAISNDPILGATVEIVELSQNLTTDVDGIFGNTIAAGDYTLNFSADNYFPESIAFSLLEQDSIEILMPLNPKPSNLFETLHEKILRNYPNPFDDFTVIDIEGIDKAKYIKIFDIKGQLVREREIKGLQQVLMKKEGLKSGVFGYKIVAENGQVIGIGKMIIQ